METLARKTKRKMKKERRQELFGEMFVIERWKEQSRTMLSKIGVELNVSEDVLNYFCKKKRKVML